MGPCGSGIQREPCAPGGLDGPGGIPPGEPEGLGGPGGYPLGGLPSPPGGLPLGDPLLGSPLSDCHLLLGGLLPLGYPCSGDQKSPGNSH